MNILLVRDCFHSAMSTERTPLVSEIGNGHNSNRSTDPSPDRLPEAHELSRRATVTILGAIWVGVFLAAVDSMLGCDFQQVKYT